MKSAPSIGRWRRSIRALDRVAAVLALGGLALAAWPREAPPALARTGPLRPALRAPVVLIWEGRATSADRCLVPAETWANDPGFLMTAPEVDPGMIASPRVVGLPVLPSWPARGR